MKMPPRYVLISAGAVAMLMVFWFAANAWIWKPAAATEKRIDSANASLERRMRVRQLRLTRRHLRACARQLVAQARILLA